MAQRVPVYRLVFTVSVILCLVNRDLLLRTGCFSMPDPGYVSILCAAVPAFPAGKRRRCAVSFTVLRPGEYRRIPGMPGHRNGFCPGIGICLTVVDPCGSICPGAFRIAGRLSCDFTADLRFNGLRRFLAHG